MAPPGFPGFPHVVRLQRVSIKRVSLDEGRGRHPGAIALCMALVLVAPGR